MGKRLERFGEVRIVDETKNGFALDFVKKTERVFWSATPDVGQYWSFKHLSGFIAWMQIWFPMKVIIKENTRH